MQILRRRLWVILLLMTLVVSGLSLPPHNTSLAQSDEVLARIDQAMAHLGERLGITITRQSHFWQWAEVVYDDESLGCPTPGQSYEPAQRRAYRIRITVDGVEYDYRAEKDGSVLILCLNGQPDPSSVGIGDVGPNSVTLPSNNFYTVVYTQDDDRLHWLNTNGEVASRDRPKLPGEAANANARMRISRNGRYLIEAAELANGSEILGIFDLQSGAWVETYQALLGETIVLGNPRFTTDPNSVRVAVGYYTVPAQGQQPAWRIVKYDLINGDVLDELRSDGQEISSFVGGEVFTQTVYLPWVYYYDFDEAFGEEIIYLQFVVLGTSTSDNPALAWYPNGVPGLAQELLSSPHTRIPSDWNPATGSVVFQYLDPNTGLLAGNNPAYSHNAVATGTPSTQGNASGPTVVYATPTLRIGAARWVSNGQQIVINAVNQNGDEDWYVMPSSGGNPILLDANTTDVWGTPTGYASSLGDGSIIYTPSNGAGNIIFTNPSNNPSSIIWATTPASLMQIGTLSLQTLGSAPDVVILPAGPVHCPGTLPSQVEVGMLARVTFTDGTPLRIRETPGGPILAEMPEGTQFNVIGGPQCQGQFTWWQITRLPEGQTGWVAEGGDNSYFIEPATGSQ